MLVAAAVVPEAPLFLPGATGTPIAEVEVIREAARTAVHWLLAREPDALVAVAGGSLTRAWPATADPGVDRHTGAAASAGEVLPAGLAVLVTVLAGDRAPQLHSVAGSAAPADARALGAELAGSAARVGMLVAADGSARRGSKAPGHFDPRAAAFDSGVEAALARGDAHALLALDARLAAELLVAGRAAWQVLAGAAVASAAAGGRAVRGRLDYSGDPFGVAYFVARWET